MLFVTSRQLGAGYVPQGDWLRVHAGPGLLFVLWLHCMLFGAIKAMGCLTTYGIGSALLYFGAGYVPQGDWLRVSLQPGCGVVLCLLQCMLLGATLLWCRLRAPGRLAEGASTARLCG
jgi:di/tricarboxylate transporter